MRATGGRSARVLHIVGWLGGGGAETFVHELVPPLRRRGVDARVLCGYGTSRLTEGEADAWAGIVYCQRRNGVPRLQYLKQMRQIVRDVAPDIVHTHAHIGAFWGRAAAALERVPIIVYTEHMSVTRLPPFELAAQKILHRRTDAIVTFSECTAGIARRRENVRNVHIIPNGIQVRPKPESAERRAARQKLGIDEHHIVVGMVANLHLHKNPALAIDAVARLPIGTRNVIRLAFFGDGPLRDDLLSQANTLGIGALVRFYGFRDDVNELLPGLDVLLSTSLREMMPMALLEAMGAALPIIGVPHAGTLDLVVDGETGIVLKSWDADELARAIEWTTAQPEWRIRVGDAAYLRLKTNFDIETIADQYIVLYNGLLRRHTKPSRTQVNSSSS